LHLIEDIVSPDQQEGIPIPCASSSHINEEPSAAAGSSQNLIIINDDPIISQESMEIMRGLKRKMDDLIDLT